MTGHNISTRLLDTASALALSASAVLGAAAFTPAEAQQGIYGGGSTLISLTARQIFDCYHGTPLSGDGYAFSATLAPSYLPTTCTVSSATSVVGLYAAVGSGSGQRGYIANDPHQLLQSPSGSGPFTFPTPATPPAYVDGTGSGSFGTYPYPKLDFGAGDSPLPNPSIPTTLTTLGSATTTLVANYLTTASFSDAGFSPASNWQTTNAVTAPAGSSTVVNYSTSTYGQPIQIPAAEVPVAIIVNLNAATAGFVTDNSGNPTTTAAGGAIQLSAAQICAIFSGEVTDWNSTQAIAYLPAGTTVATTTSTTAPNYFYADNKSSVTAATAYVSAPNSLPITVVYRSDGSGTSYITTNYLHAVCPLLDNGSNNYALIFGASNLPSTSFSNLISNIQANGPTAAAKAAPSSWIGVSGSLNVAQTVGNSTAAAGRIGYVSNDFTAAYANPTIVTTSAPASASLQDEYLRASGVNHPGDSGSLGSAQNFVAPTPTGAQSAWSSQTYFNPPSNTTATFNDWNVYNINYPTGTAINSGGLDLQGRPYLPLTNTSGAYPLTGTTYFYFYSCYKETTGTRVSAIQNFVSWLAAGSDGGIASGSAATSSNTSPQHDVDVSLILANNGFRQLPPRFADALIAEYVLPGTTTSVTGNTGTFHGTGTTAIQSASAGTDGCSGGVTGAN